MTEETPFNKIGKLLKIRVKKRTNKRKKSRRRNKEEEVKEGEGGR